eukprot:3422823-Rhodomonas_salina.1
MPASGSSLLPTESSRVATTRLSTMMFVRTKKRGKKNLPPTVPQVLQERASTLAHAARSYCHHVCLAQRQRHTLGAEDSYGIRPRECEGGRRKREKR